MADSTCISEEPIAKRLRSTHQSRSSLWTGAPPQPARTIYETLDEAKRDIRLCDLLRSSDSSAPLECSLQIVPVNRMGKYVAFSYVWGQEPATETISINGIQHPIRHNLAAGLRELRAQSWRDCTRKRPRSRFISVWADAICINQEDIAERNHQVPHMRSIFSKCDYTFSWLGEADDTSDLAMDSIAEVETVARLRGGIPLLRTLTQEGNSFYKAGPWIAIYKLLNREFWHRVWIYQELILPNRLVLACGSKYLPSTIFMALNTVRMDVMYWKNDYEPLRKAFAHLDSDVLNEMIAVCKILQRLFSVLGRYHWPRANILSFVWEVTTVTSHLKATDAQDKIYGILPRYKYPPLQPDYSKTKHELHTEFAKLVLNHQSLLLQWSGLFNCGNNAHWASWVPNWDHITQSNPTTAAPWKESSDAINYSRACTPFLHSTEFKFQDTPHLTA
jgi:Heterokaryon incompatibility protein (HET)